MNRFSKTFGVVAIAWSMACGGAGTPTLPAQSGEVAPYPYTVPQIRAGCHDRVIQYRIEKPGAASTEETWTFRDLDSDTVEVTTTRFDESGKAIGAAEVKSAKWSDLHEHARFPRAATTIDDDTVPTPAGKIDCMRYVVTSGDEVKTYWFARSLPGPPVKFTNMKGHEVLMSMTMQANRTK